ncbi:PLD-like domain-containing protein [Nitrosospira sp. Nsp18]|uniref:phospholipase D family nuclease n=1 Tax=Nitrosospira sp. Nsp18 TaxID=1855334 RepID=UPI0008846B98|nr:phospholipase D family protein [Nitrosospira sp. Nsp18]SDA23972.1 PLD-like domain-containing protein [Nitrosospira sp. Nsp18]
MTSLRHCATLSVAGYLAILFAAPHAAGFEPTSGHGHKPPIALPASGTVQAAFTPGDDAGKLIADAIDTAHHQVLVQTFSFTHRKIADALIAAKRRGVEVKVIADKDQTHRIPTSLISKIADEGVPVFTDSDHTSAHNKVIVIDADSPDATLITGSFNFTHAAQYRNAENVLLIRGNAALTDLYLQNWHRHYKHSQPYR